jgi:hypothetical protein
VRGRTLALSACTFCALSAGVLAQSFPSRPSRFIVAQGGATGGGTSAAFTALIASERVRLADVNRRAKIPVED